MEKAILVASASEAELNDRECSALQSGLATGNRVAGRGFFTVHGEESAVDVWRAGLPAGCIVYDVPKDCLGYGGVLRHDAVRRILEAHDARNETTAGQC